MLLFIFNIDLLLCICASFAVLISIYTDLYNQCVQDFAEMLLLDIFPLLVLTSWHFVSLTVSYTFSISHPNLFAGLMFLFIFHLFFPMTEKRICVIGKTSSVIIIIHQCESFNSSHPPPPPQPLFMYCLI